MRHTETMFYNFPKLNYQICRVVTKISSCRANTTSRRGIKWLGISFGSIFLLFSNKSSRGPPSQQLWKIPGPRLLMTTLDMQRHFNHNFLSSYRYYPQHMQGNQFKFITRQYPFGKKRNGNFNPVFSLSHHQK